MIPSVNYDENSMSYEDKIKPTSYTYKLDTDNNRIYSMTDERDAMAQAIYKILNTERFEYEIYSWNYGVELNKYFGESTKKVQEEIKDTILEALGEDDRIENVENFIIGRNGNAISVKFTAVTSFGDISVEKEVRV